MSKLYIKLNHPTKSKFRIDIILFLSIHELKLENEHETVKNQLLLQFSSTNDFGSKVLKESTETSLAKRMNEKSGNYLSNISGLKEGLSLTNFDFIDFGR